MRHDNTRSKRIYKALDILTRKQRDVFILRIYARMRYKEIAAHLHTSAHACEVNFGRAKAKLQSHIQEKNSNDEKTIQDAP